MPPPLPDAPFVFSPATGSGGAGPLVPGGTIDPTGAAPDHSAGQSAGQAKPVAPANADLETRHEISAIIREVAREVGSNRPVSKYVALLVDRIYKAAAPGGVSMWQFRELSATPATSDQIESGLEVIRRCGTTTDRGLPEHEADVHRRLIAEVLAGGAAVVVPPDPGGDDGVDTEARNPMTTAVAIVPIPTAHPLDYGYAIEVFFDDQTPPAAWKPYLRFLAQIADLAGQFFVIDHLQRLTRSAEYASTLAAINGSMPATASATAVAERFVDAVADQFNLRRVSWIDTEPKKPLVVAVSHCDKVDAAAAGTLRLVEAAGQSNGKPLLARIVSLGNVSDQDSDAKPSEPTPLPPNGPEPPPDRQRVGQIVVRPGRDVALVIETDVDQHLQSERVDPGDLIDASFLDPLSRGLTTASSTAVLAQRLDQIPLARLFANRPRKSWARRTAIASAVGIIAAMMIFFPMPQNVLASVTLRPLESQTVVCTRDCIVDFIGPRHGQVVSPGQTLAVLRDPALETQRLELSARVSGLQQRHQSIAQRLVDPSTPRDQHRRLEDEQTLVDTQIAGANQTLAAVTAVIDQLTISADRDGIVDAWQVGDRVGRPMGRGEVLMRILPRKPDWQAVAAVPRRRIGWVHMADQKGILRAELRIDGSVATRRPATLHRYGPPVRSGTPAGSHFNSTAMVQQLPPISSAAAGGSPVQSFDPAMWVGFVVASKDVPDDPAWRSGAPGRLMLYCGEVSLGRWLGGDLVDWARRQTASMLGVWQWS